jgi:hypothetical protein
VSGTALAAGVCLKPENINVKQTPVASAIRLTEWTKQNLACPDPERGDANAFRLRDGNTNVNSGDSVC